MYAYKSHDIYIAPEIFYLFAFLAVDKDLEGYPTCRFPRYLSASVKYTYMYTCSVIAHIQMM